MSQHAMKANFIFKTSGFHRRYFSQFYHNVPIQFKLSAECTVIHSVINSKSLA